MGAAGMPEPARRQSTPAAIYPMCYQPVPEDVAPGLNPSAAADSAGLVTQLATRVQGLEQELEARARRYESELERARREAGDAALASAQAAQASAIQSLEKAIGELARARDRYLADVEQEVVRLALAIAARILRREALMDPLLLSGAVRVALGQLPEKTGVKLLVPAAEKEMWSERLRQMPDLLIQPEVVADEQLGACECRVETSSGSVDLGVKSQLVEIERGFFDLLEKRDSAFSH